MARMRMATGVLACVAIGSGLLSNHADADTSAIAIYAPADGGVVLGQETMLDVRGCAREGRDLHLTVDGQPRRVDWSRGAYRGQWVARLKLEREGRHWIALHGPCEARAHFRSLKSGAADVAWSVARNFIHQHDVSTLGWDWGPGVFLYGLSKLDPAAPWISQYHAAWAAQGVAQPDHADTCAPGLTALELMRQRDDYAGFSSAQAVARYLDFAPRNALGAINHMGTWFWSFLFPPSIWVDSLEMMAVFATKWGRFMGDDVLLHWGAEQPIVYASALQDAATGLFRHAWDLSKNVTIPKSATFWLRGNGWAMASIVDILEELDAAAPQRAQLIAILDRLARGLLAYQQKSGYWDSIANLPGATYGESSGTALAAYAIAKGVHHGWLDASLLPAAKAAFAAVTSRLLPKGAAQTERGVPLRLSLPRVSWSTDPGPRWYYELIPAVSDIDYGVGAFLMAGAELRDEEF